MIPIERNGQRKEDYLQSRNVLYRPLPMHLPLEVLKPRFGASSSRVMLVEHLLTYLNNVSRHLERNIVAANIPIYYSQYMLRCQSIRMILGQCLLPNHDHLLQQ